MTPFQTGPVEATDLWSIASVLVIPTLRQLGQVDLFSRHALRLSISTDPTGVETHYVTFSTDPTSGEETFTLHDVATGQTLTVI